LLRGIDLSSNLQHKFNQTKTRPPPKKKELAKKYLPNVAHLSTSESDRQRTTFTTHSATFSPQKNHTQHHTFRTPPSKNARKTAKVGGQKASHFFATKNPIPL
jgi:hypothetical protein